MQAITYLDSKARLDMVDMATTELLDPLFICMNNISNILRNKSISYYY